jgi:hypothetical protein
MLAPSQASWSIRSRYAGLAGPTLAPAGSESSATAAEVDTASSAAAMPHAIPPEDRQRPLMFIAEFPQDPGPRAESCRPATPRKMS